MPSFLGGSDVKNLPAIQEAPIHSLGQDDLPWTEEPARLRSIASQRVRHNWSNLHTHTHTPSSTQLSVGVIEIIDVNTVCAFNKLMYCPTPFSWSQLLFAPRSHLREQTVGSTATLLMRDLRKEAENQQNSVQEKNSVARTVLSISQPCLLHLHFPRSHLLRVAGLPSLHPNALQSF